MNTNENNNSVTTIKELEDMRVSINMTRGIITSIVIIIGVVLAFITHTIEFFVFSIIIGIFISAIATYGKAKNFNLLYKNTIVLSVFKKLFNNINYNPDFGISRDVIASTEMVDMGNEYESNDYLSATYKNIKFETADVTITQVTHDSKGNTHRSTYFKGQWYVFDFNKNFKSNIQVCEYSFMHNKTGGLFSSNRLRKIELEDMEFHKKFEVFAQNDLEAFYILTPSVIQRIKLLEEKINGALILCFVNNKLHLGVHNYKDFFEPSLSRPINLEQDEQNILNSTNDIINFINDLQLDNDLFRREV